MLNHWLLIFTLAAVTYLSRFIGLQLMAGRAMPATWRLYFDYVPIAIICALILKQMLLPVNGQLTLSQPVLAAAAVTIVSMRWLARFLPSVGLGVIAGLAVRHLLG